MQQISRVHELETLQVLVDNVLLVDVFEDVGADHSMQVCVHEVEYQVDIAVIFSANYVLEANNVLMARQLLQENDLTEGTLGVSCVLEGIEVFLHCHDLLGAFINGLPNDTISSLSYRQINIHAMTASLPKADKKNKGRRSNSNSC